MNVCVFLEKNEKKNLPTLDQFFSLLNMKRHMGSFKAVKTKSKHMSKLSSRFWYTETDIIKSKLKPISYAG